MLPAIRLRGVTLPGWRHETGQVEVAQPYPKSSTLLISQPRRSKRKIRFNLYGG